MHAVSGPPGHARERELLAHARRARCRPRRSSTRATSSARAPRGTAARWLPSSSLCAASSSALSCDSGLAAVERRAHEPRDDAVGLAKGHPEPHQQVGDVGRRDQLVRGGLAHALAVEAHARDHPARGRERQLERVDRVEQVLLVLLQVLVVGQRQRVHHAVERRQVPDDARRLRAQQLGRVGVLLLRHDRGARAPRVRAARRSRTRRCDHSTSSAPRRERCVAQVAAAPR